MMEARSVTQKECPKIEGAIRGKENMKKGKTYRLYNSYNGMEFKFIKDLGNGQFLYTGKDDWKGRKNKKEGFFADFGIEPYENGLWNSENYVIIK